MCGIKASEAQWRGSTLRVCQALLKSAVLLSEIAKRLTFIFGNCTLTYRIIVQDGINVQAGKIPKINKRAGWNKAVQVGIFHFLLVKIKVLA